MDSGEEGIPISPFEFYKKKKKKKKKNSLNTF